MNKLLYAPYSYSKISTFYGCPKKFEYQYIRKIPSIWKDSVALDRGKLIHLILEMNRDISKIKSHKDFIGIKNRNLLGPIGIKECFKVYDTITKSKVLEQIFNKIRLFAEMPIGLDYDLNIMEYNPKDEKLHNLLLRGYIDAAFIKTGKDDEEDVLILVDWKSGKVPEKQTWDQLLWYSLGLFSKMPFNKIILAYVYVDHEKMNLKTVHRSEIEKYKQALYNTVDKIETCTNFVKNETALCNYCDHQEICIKESLENN